MAEKARFYLEQSIPELKELEKKKIFSKEEISSITKKRSEFEHKVNSNGCKPIDWARYAEYEMNLETLRKKRVKRLGVKSRTYFGQRRIFFVLDRATRRFHGDLGLWMQYIEFAQKEKASKVLMKVFAAVLKMHPTKPELWIFAAKHAVDENADMTEARSYMQRGLRFNKKSEQLWVEYAKLELIYIAKILARRRLLGIDGLGGGDSGQKRIGDGNGRDEEGDEAMISLPGLTAEDLDPSIVKDPSIAALALENIETNPALNGAIPLAVFDAATQEIPNDIDFIRQFFDLFASFTELPCLQSLVSHVAQAAYNNYPTSPMALFLYAMCPTVGLQLSDPAFPGALGMMIQRIGGLVGRAQPAAQFYQLFLSHLFTLFQNGELDPSLKKVLRVTITKYLKQAEAEGSLTEELFAQWLMFLESGCTARKEEPETLQDGL